MSRGWSGQKATHQAQQKEKGAFHDQYTRAFGSMYWMSFDMV